MTQSSGKAWKLGDNIGTDMLAPGLYMKRPIAEMAQHCLEDVEPGFVSGVKRGDVVVAGRNFGMGSSREQAAEALLHLGVNVVLAKSYGGLFYRNALNLGLLVLICADTDRIAAGDSIAVEPESGVVRNLTRNETYACETVPAHLMEMVNAGGLVPYLARKLEAQRAAAR
jgi:3-isopropylmalate/(R)-2-methylmalate dehydratase small subunit